MVAGVATKKAGKFPEESNPIVYVPEPRINQGRKEVLRVEVSRLNGGANCLPKAYASLICTGLPEGELIRAWTHIHR